MNIKLLFGKKVKEYRIKSSMTQEELAEKIGISAKSLSQIELGNNFVSAETLDAICSALNTNLIFVIFNKSIVYNLFRKNYKTISIY